MGKPYTLRPALRRYQIRHQLTTPALAAALSTTPDRLACLAQCVGPDADDPRFTPAVTRLARHVGCEADSLAVILLEDVERAHA